MRRTFVRWFLAIIGVVAILAGAFAVGGAAWVRSVLDPSGTLSSATQSLDATGCETLLIEVADVDVRADELEDFGLVTDRAERTLAVEVRPVESVAGSTLLVGVADSGAIESRLLGSRYCLAEASPSGWVTRSITVTDNAPDVPLAGLTGLWARAERGNPVIVPIPESGNTLVVSSDGTSEVGEVLLTGRFRIVGAPDFVRAGFIAGSISIGLGVVLLLVSTLALRRRGRHEGASGPTDTAGIAPS